MSAREVLALQVRMFRLGASRSGWGCNRCGRLFPHDGRRRRTFARLALHTAISHRKLPVHKRKAAA